MSRIREQIADELATKVDRHGVVVWIDPEGAYTALVDDVLPNDASFDRYEGSWLSLRKGVENLLVGDTPPRLVVYISAEAPDPDPLAEIRSLGTEFRILLPSLVRRALGGELTDQRIDQLADQCSTAAEVEAAVAGGEDSVDARLISLVMDPSTSAICSEVLFGTLDDQLDERNLWPEVARFFADAIGGDYGEDSGDGLRAAVLRQLVLMEIAAALDELPSDLAGSLASTSAGQRRTGAAVIARLRSDDQNADTYAGLVEEAEGALRLGSFLDWSDGLATVDATPVIEQLAIDAAVRMLSGGDPAPAASLAEQRLDQSYWVNNHSDLASGYAATWRAIRALAELAAATAQPTPQNMSLGDLATWYADDGWRADAAFRRVELIRVTAGLALDELDDLFHQMRLSYEEWLDSGICASTMAADEDAHLDPDVLQRTIHERQVRGSTGSTAFILVDALRYELGRDLADRLERVAAEVDLTYAVATPPTITPVGMAAVLPGAEAAFGLDLGSDDRLVVTVDGDAVGSVKDRVQRLELAHGKVADFALDWLAQARNTDIKRKLVGTDLVLVRSTEIDAGGESDQLAASWAGFDGTLNVLHTAVAKLLHAGVGRVVITADHGFLAVQRLSDDRKVDRPSTGVGELHRRAWIGRGGTETEATVRVPLEDFGISGDLDIITPKGLGVFTSGGGLQFFHGGLSLQELIIPVITVVRTDAGATPKYEITLAVAGERITTGVVAVTVAMSGDLFTRESGVRLQLTQQGDRVARTVGGDGVDFATEVIDATVDKVRVITMQVTANLVAGSTATLEVLDAATGVRLGDPLEVEIAANVLVEDEL